MRVFYLYCHPLEASLHAAIRDVALEALRRSGHDVDLCDLYAEGFEPVLTARMRAEYHDLSKNREGLEAYIARLHAAEALVVQFPTWCFGFPAMLKGFFDRLFSPGIAFDLSNPAAARPLLTHIKHVIGISTYGRPWSRAFLVGDPPRKMVTRYLRWFVARSARIRYFALYHLNIASEAQRARFIAKIGKQMGRLT